ncbi:MAG: lysoplasmalogenase [Solibacillus sp.]
MLRKILFTLFISFACYYVFWFDTIQDSFKMPFKLIPMLLLIVLALQSPSTRYKWLIVTGLAFCMIGDYTLQWFIIGLSSFLIGHVFYIIAFRSSVSPAPKLAKILLIMYGLSMAIWLAGTLLTRGEIIVAIAVCAYIIIISMMGWTAFHTNESFAIIGALLFITSDSILAINRFIIPVPFEHEMIMLTYYTAQFFLMLSIRKIQQKVIQ